MHICVSVIDGEPMFLAGIRGVIEASHEFLYVGGVSNTAGVKKLLSRRCDTVIISEEMWKFYLAAGGRVSARTRAVIITRHHCGELSPQNVQPPCLTATVPRNATSEEILEALRRLCIPEQVSEAKLLERARNMSEG
ncbi:response regulator transcription factor [Corynebacterium belfantii]|nr:response regulator transcription factor [Corynebacterium belfantii]MBG9334610.1 response regulator transcription factor [Corynebacterium belfantii]